MKFAEIRLHDSAPDSTGTLTATFRNVNATVEPWGLWVGSLLLPWSSIRYARGEAAAVGVTPHGVEELEALAAAERARSLRALLSSSPDIKPIRVTEEPGAKRKRGKRPIP